ncbi:acyl-coenzyme A thioesterase 8-like [Ptychodera flava]|uniref:acyl-coenzyme A thioesterase 8-like n=1 Tax=Ptychodera flava TaxID=63121 RepID=UPI00396A40BE
MNRKNYSLRNILVDTVLNLEELDVNLYRSSNHWRPLLNPQRLFGGQVIGQALVAAGKTVDPGLHAHSLHAYFIKPGQNSRPILYRVERLRDGRSYATRSISAVQQGNAILTMQASFNREEYSEFKHQYTMPVVPPPEQLLNTWEFTDKHMDQFSDTLQEYVRERRAVEVPIEMKPIDPKLSLPFIMLHKYLQDTDEPKRMVWMKAIGDIGEDEHLNRCLAAYCSDMTFAMTSRLARPKIELGMITSLDHSIWFHAPFRCDEWMLYDFESPRSGGGRGFNLGRLWRRDGTLAVSIAQESVLRAERKATSKL